VAILKGYNFNKEDLNLHIKNITDQFQSKETIYYKLDPQSYLILSKDQRKMGNRNRYTNSPFPLLSNVDKFRNTVGQWNSSLLDYGIKTRLKLLDDLQKPS
jgi:hypothetical protein